MPGMCVWLSLLCICIAPTWAWQTFTPSAFTIQRIVGQLGFATEVEWQYYSDGEKRNRNPLDPNQPSRTVEASGISVRLFQGELFGGEKVLLKEYLSCAREIGENELSMYTLLCDDGKENPVQLGSLLGHMQSDSSFDSAVFRDNWSRSIPSTPPPASGNLWLVFRWEGLATVGAFPRVPQPRPWLDLTGGRQMRDARAKYLMVLTGRCLQVLAYLHGKGVVHRSLGPSSLLLSTSQQDEAERLTVRLIDLGFAASASSLPQEEVENAMRRGASSPLAVLPMLALNDLHGLGYVLLELFLASAAAQVGSRVGEGVPGRRGVPSRRGCP